MRDVFVFLAKLLLDIERLSAENRGVHLPTPVAKKWVTLTKDMS